MTATLNVDDEDIDFGIARDHTATIQLVVQKLQLWLGEWFLDTALGVPYYEELIERIANREAFRLILDAQVRSVVNVTNATVTYQSFNRRSRRLTIRILVETIFDSEEIEMQTGL